jgi:hypothetical protein
MNKKDELRRIAAALLINPLPRSVRDDLLADRAFVAKFGITPQFNLALGGGVSVESGSLHAALRAGTAGKKTATLKLADKSKVRARLELRKSGHVSLQFKGRGINFTDADLLSGEKARRLRALKRVFAARPLLNEEERGWWATAEERSLSDHEFVTLMTELGATPEALTEALNGPMNLDAEQLMPDDPAYYHRLLAPLNGSQDLLAFIGAELAINRGALLKRHRPRALRRIAYSALWQPLIPFNALGAVTPKELSLLLPAEDPFSLLFGFEVCRARVSDRPDCGPLGTRFLEKLIGGGELSQARNYIFSACATIASGHIRRAAKASASPLLWTRLAAFTHAGVLTHALQGLNNPKGFFEWSVENFGAQYLWHGAIDRREAPRWRPDWVSPEHLHAELIGRANAALHASGTEHCPPEWQTLIEAQLKELKKAGRSLATIFPGPFDDFRPAPSLEGNPFFQKLETELQGVAKLSDADGVLSVAYATVPSPAFVGEVVRIVSAPPDQPIAEDNTEHLYLDVAAHIAASCHSEQLARAVIDRCLFIARNQSERISANDLFMVMLEACAALSDPKLYHSLIAEKAAQLAFAQREIQAMAQLISVFDVLGQRDPKLVASLSRARAILQTGMRAA